MLGLFTSLLPFITTIGGALMGKAAADEQREQRKKMERINAIEAKYSWGAPSQYQALPKVGSEWGQILGGGLQGLSMGSNVAGVLGKLPAFAASPAKVDFGKTETKWMPPSPPESELVPQTDPEQYFRPGGRDVMGGASYAVEPMAKNPYAIALDQAKKPMRAPASATPSAYMGPTQAQVGTAYPAMGIGVTGPTQPLYTGIGAGTGYRY